MQGTCISIRNCQYCYFAQHALLDTIVDSSSAHLSADAKACQVPRPHDSNAYSVSCTAPMSTSLHSFYRNKCEESNCLSDFIVYSIVHDVQCSMLFATLGSVFVHVWPLASIHIRQAWDLGTTEIKYVFPRHRVHKPRGKQLDIHIIQNCKPTTQTRLSW